MSYSKQSTVPIELLPGIGRRTALVLSKLEIKTIGQFQQMPEKILIELFGPSIKSVYRQVNPKPKKKIIKKPALQKNWFEKTKLASVFMSFL